MPDLDEEERGVALGSLSQESRTARDERKSGIVIESMPCPLLVLAGSDDRVFPKSLYEGMGLGEELMEAEGASHWGLVLNRRVMPGLVRGVGKWLDGVMG